MDEKKWRRALPAMENALPSLGGERRIWTVGEMYLSAEAAATELGVTLPTFYSYVSRKAVRSKGVAGSRRRLYWRPDIEALRRGEADALARRVALTSNITLVTAQGPFYRGKSAIALSRTETLETVAALLWDIPEMDAFDKPPCAMGPDLANSILASAQNPIDTCCIAMALLESRDRMAFDFSRLGFSRTSASALRWGMALSVGAPTPTSEPLHEFMQRHLDIGSDVGDLLRRVMVLSADHGVTTGAAAVRCIAARGVSPYRLAAAGLIAATGRRQPFGQVGALSLMVEEFLGAADPADAVMQRLREGLPLLGFGAGAYGVASDPRAEELLNVLEERFRGQKSVQKLLKACAAVEDLTGMHPDFALVVVFVARLAGVAAPYRMMIHFARIAGWAAHGFEEYCEENTLRVGEYYTGPLPQFDE